MNAKGSEIDIVCSQGEHALGGIDFDEKILEILQKMYKDKMGAELITSDEDRAKYEDEAEDIKKTLSRRSVARKMCYGSAGSMKIEITRKAFEEAISSLVGRTDMLVEVALEEAGLKPCEIDKVLLVGGSTRIPLVQQNLEKMFGFAPETTVNVDECVALGAALHAGLTLQREKPDLVSAGISGGLRDIKLKDVCNHSYGTICAPIDEKTGRHEIKNHIILKKNTPLPCEVSQTFCTMVEGQKELKITVTQGEDDSPEYVNKIATHIFELPEGRPANCPIEVTYIYDVNQRMHCKFKDVKSGKVFKVDFCLDQNGDIKQTKGKKQLKQLEAITIE